MPPVRLLGLGTAVPPASVGPDEAYRILGYDDTRVLRLFRNAGVEKRHVGLENLENLENPENLAPPRGDKR